jgi:hypothetical protein
MKLSARDADGRVRLAKDYKSDVGDLDTAVKLLLEATQIEADLPEAAEELKSLGYTRGPQGWVRGRDSDSPAKSEAAGSSRTRSPQIDMTAEQIREILGSPLPQEITRFTDRRGGRQVVLEQWTFRGPKDLYVTFQVISSTESRVIAITSPSQK